MKRFGRNQKRRLKAELKQLSQFHEDACKNAIYWKQRALRSEELHHEICLRVQTEFNKHHPWAGIQHIGDYRERYVQIPTKSVGMEIHCDTLHRLEYSFWPEKDRNLMCFSAGLMGREERYYVSDIEAFRVLVDVNVRNIVENLTAKLLTALQPAEDAK